VVVESSRGIVVQESQQRKEVASNYGFETKKHKFGQLDLFGKGQTLTTVGSGEGVRRLSTRVLRTSPLGAF
jgi:hypothetical protein